MTSTSRRLLKELRDYTSDTSSTNIINLAPVSETDLSKWRAVLVGMEGTPYEGLGGPNFARFSTAAAVTNENTGGHFTLDITTPQTYPLDPPTIRFDTTVCHPNVHAKVRVL